MNYDPNNRFSVLSNNIITYVDNINNFKCPTNDCNNSKLDSLGFCTVCGYTNEDISNCYNNLEIMIIKIDQYFKNGINTTYRCLDKLYTLKNINIDFVNKYLNKLNYEEIRNKTYISLKEKLYNEEISNNELTSLQSIIATKEILDEEDFDILTKLVFNKNITKDAFRRYVVEFTKKMGKEYNIYVNEVNIGNIDNKYDAVTINNDITFSEKYIDKAFDLNEQDNFYFLMFHELEHVNQNYEIKNNIISPKTCKYVYDYILMNNDKDFYDNYYNLINQEVDADTKAYIYTKRLKDKYSIEYPESILKHQILSTINTYNGNDDKLIEYKRKYHDLVYMALLSNSDLYDEHPQLHIEFKKDETGIKRRSKEEIQSEIDDYNNLCNELNEIKESYGISNFKKLFINEETKHILKNKDITYMDFYNRSNINKVRLEILDSFKYKEEIKKNNNNRGYSNIAILILSMVAIVLLIIFIIILIRIGR